MDIIKFSNVFEGSTINTCYYKGRLCWVAKEIAVALGYAQGGRRFVGKVNGEWSKDFIEGHDYTVLIGSELREFKKRVLDLSKHAARITLFFEAGLHVGCIMTRKPVGRRLRRFIVDKMIPEATDYRSDGFNRG